MADRSNQRGREALVDSRQLASLCHDLKQYVGAALIVSSVPEDAPLESEIRRRFDLIQQTLTHAATLLESARLETPPRLVTMNLKALAEECAGVAEFRHKVRLEDVTEIAPLVTADPTVLRRAVDNMIDNASRAASEHGQVVVRVGSAGDRVWIEVSDDGPGFGAIVSGTGHGLSVVNSTARSYGGRLEISSGPEPGTTVRLSFPLATSVHPDLSVG